MSEDTFTRLMRGAEEALRMARGDLSAGRISTVVAGRVVDITETSMRTALDAMSTGATPGTWTYEIESDGTATLYAGRSHDRHGLNLLGRLEIDGNGAANLDLIVSLVNAYRSGRLVVKVEKEHDPHPVEPQAQGDPPTD